MKAKKLVSMILCGAMAFSLAACGGSSKDSGAASGSAASAEAESAASSADAESEATSAEAASEASSAEDAAEAVSAEASSTSVETTTTEDGDEYIHVTVALPNDVGSLSPFDAGVFQAGAKATEIFDQPMLRTGRDTEFEPNLAYKYEKVADRTFRIYFYDNIYDSDGNHFTANDAKFSLETWHELNNSPSTLAAFDSCEVVDDYTLDLIVNTDEYKAEETIINCATMVTQAAYEEHDMTTDPVGTGPYVLKEWIPGTSLTLVKNENYWAKDDIKNPKKAQNADEITYMFNSESSQVAIAMESGEVDYAYNLNKTERERLNGEGFSEWTRLFDNMYWMEFNCSDQSPFQDVNLRKAVAYAIDINDLILAGFDGDAIQGYSHCASTVAEWKKEWEDAEKYYPYDLDKALELAAEAGVSPDNPIDVMIINQGKEEENGMSLYIQSQLAQIGINVSIQTYDYATYNTYHYDPSKWDMYLYTPGAFWVCNFGLWFWDQRAYGGTTENFLKDDTLQEKLETAANSKTFSEETLKDYIDYADYEAFPAYGLCQYYLYATHVPSIEVTTYDATFFVYPGSWTYTNFES